jgi:hypothetical protein
MNEKPTATSRPVSNGKATKITVTFNGKVIDTRTTKRPGGFKFVFVSQYTVAQATSSIKQCLSFAQQEFNEYSEDLNLNGPRTVRFGREEVQKWVDRQSKTIQSCTDRLNYLTSADRSGDEEFTTWRVLSYSNTGKCNSYSANAHNLTCIEVVPSL